MVMMVKEVVERPIVPLDFQPLIELCQFCSQPIFVVQPFMSEQMVCRTLIFPPLVEFVGLSPFFALVLERKVFEGGIELS